MKEDLDRKEGAVPPGIEIPGIPARKPVKGGTRMGRPLLFIDFDGVINQFPDDKVMRRQGRTGWMRPDDPHRAAYAPDNWFRPDRRERLLVRDLGRRFVIRWNAELVARLDALDADHADEEPSAQTSHDSHTPESDHHSPQTVHTCLYQWSLTYP